MKKGSERLTNKKRYKAIVDGHQYTIIGEESKEHLDLVVKMVDEQLQVLKEKLQDASSEQIAILLSINLMNDLVKRQSDNLVLIKEKEQAVSELEAIKIKLESLKLEAEEARNSEVEMRKILEQYQIEEAEKKPVAGIISEIEDEEASESVQQKKILNKV